MASHYFFYCNTNWYVSYTISYFAIIGSIQIPGMMSESQETTNIPVYYFICILKLDIENNCQPPPQRRHIFSFLFSPYSLLLLECRFADWHHSDFPSSSPFRRSSDSLRFLSLVPALIAKFLVVEEDIGSSNLPLAKKGLSSCCSVPHLDLPAGAQDLPLLIRRRIIPLATKGFETSCSLPSGVSPSMFPTLLIIRVNVVGLTLTMTPSCILFMICNMASWMYPGICVKDVCTSFAAPPTSPKMDLGTWADDGLLSPLLWNTWRLPPLTASLTKPNSDPTRQQPICPTVRTRRWLRGTRRTRLMASSIASGSWSTKSEPVNVMPKYANLIFVFSFYMKILHLNIKCVNLLKTMLLWYFSYTCAAASVTKSDKYQVCKNAAVTRKKPNLERSNLHEF